MTVTATFQFPADAFLLGRVLEVERGDRLELEAIIPLGNPDLSCLIVSEDLDSTFFDDISNHPAVKNFRVTAQEGMAAYFIIELDPIEDELINCIYQSNGQVLTAFSTGESWTFEIRFPDDQALTVFHRHCRERGLKMSVGRFYRSGDQERSTLYGLTMPQREALMVAVRGGYYDIPREIDTGDLADELGISVQAVTERLRRAIVTLTTNTILPAGDNSENPTGRKD